MPEYEQGLADPVFPAGPYDYECVDAGEKESEKTHNAMIEVQLDCFNADFTEKVRVVDRLVFTPNCYWKIDAFRRSTAEKIHQHHKVRFEAEDCVGRRGRLQLKITTHNGKLRNEVDYYIEPDDQAEATAQSSSPNPAPTEPAPKGTAPKSDQGF